MAKSVVLLAPLLGFLLVLITFNNPDAPEAPEAEAEETGVRMRRELFETDSEMELRMMVNLVTPLMAILRSKIRLPDADAEESRAARADSFYNPDRSSYGGYGGGGCGGGCGGCGGGGGGCGGYDDGCCEEDIYPLVALAGLAALFVYLVFINGGAGKRRRRHIHRIFHDDRLG